MSGRGRGGGRAKQNVSYVKPEEPAFLKRIKEQVGFKEGPNIESKREKLPTFDDDDETERESDKPQVVVLKEGDISEEEFARIEKEKADEDEKQKIEEGKITFKKPIKRQSSNSSPDDAANVSTTKRAKNEEIQSEKPKVAVKAIDESRLLSFGDPEEDDDDDST